MERNTKRRRDRRKCYHEDRGRCRESDRRMKADEIKGRAERNKFMGEKWKKKK